MDVEAEMNLLQKINTNLNADSTEWCPNDGYQDILLCGTYKLKEQSEENCAENVTQASGENVQERDGDVIAYRLAPNVSEEGINSETKLAEVQRLGICGVLDIKWDPSTSTGDFPRFGFVDALGRFQIYSLLTDYSLKLCDLQQLSPSCLGLSLDWNHNGLVSSSDSSGCVTVFDTKEEIKRIHQFKAHDYEAWITAFQKFEENTLYTGGDDCRLKVWDVRDLSKPSFVSKRHQMGVCSVQSHPVKEHIVATGSYDEQLLIWDRRKMKSPLSCTNLGGGIWRIKWEPIQGSSILTATMYNGIHIVDTETFDGESCNIIAHYTDHNLAYGADWCRIQRQKTGETPTYVLATCSFYDQALHLLSFSSHKETAD